jgi:recombination protein RecT
MSNTPQQPTVPQTTEKIKKDVSTQVLDKIEAFKQAGELRIPEGYSPENALKAAYLILVETTNKDNKPALEHCTKESIANALLKMVVWGLSPLKKQCDFIMYGNKLDCTIEYTGNIALAKRYGGLKEIKAQVIFEGDVFEFEIDPQTARRYITKHQQTLKSLESKNILGAYAVMEMADGTRDTEIMSMSQIRDSWNQGAMKGNSPAHKNFPDQMAKKTVINRACKLLIRGSDDSILYNDEDKTIDTTAEDVTHEINKNANRKPLDFAEDVTAEEVKAEQPKEVSEETTQNQNTESQTTLGPNF